MNWPSSASRAMPTLPEPSTRAVVLDTDVASRSFKGLLSPTLAARLAGRQPLLTFVTIGELTQWTKLRRWGPRNRGTLDTWLSDKPVIPGAKSIAVIWGEAGELVRGRPWSVVIAGRSSPQLPHRCASRWCERTCTVSLSADPAPSVPSSSCQFTSSMPVFRSRAVPP
jgi:hypothetical protein